MDKVKYSGKQDNFNFKFKIFKNYYLRAGVPKQAYIITVPTILRRLALKFSRYPQYSAYTRPPKQLQQPQQL
ncbi:uncharacterized protein K441DRAFT_652096 [Cenococcum geophilum 1.58]|uniref:uncharacterized protein n=1 Tax=Cenococcum geophilum 1.58 TaxID=794803 RepID=UPI00358E4A21|nr:hypothetical protein K441DRAFT_652096 [Cenococcum geophilum 1.58]